MQMIILSLVLLAPVRLYISNDNIVLYIYMTRPNNYVCYLPMKQVRADAVKQMPSVNWLLSVTFEFRAPSLQNVRCSVLPSRFEISIPKGSRLISFPSLPCSRSIAANAVSQVTADSSISSTSNSALWLSCSTWLSIFSLTQKVFFVERNRSALACMHAIHVHVVYAHVTTLN